MALRRGSFRTEKQRLSNLLRQTEPGTIRFLSLYTREMYRRANHGSTRSVALGNRISESDSWWPARRYTAIYTLSQNEFSYSIIFKVTALNPNYFAFR